MNQLPETCDHQAVEVIVHGSFTPACRAIGVANLPTIMEAERAAATELHAAQALGEPCGGYRRRLHLIRSRRQRLDSAAQMRAGQGSKPATFRP